MLKKQSLVLLLSTFGFVLSATTSYADAPTKDISFNVTIPNLTPGFEYDITALALKPAASNLNYAILNKALPLQSPSWTEQELKPGYAPAFELGARYIFQGGNDISLDWTHLSSSTSSSVTANGVDYFVGPDYQIGPDAIPIRSAVGNVKFKYDVVNLDVGQYVDFGSHVEMRFFGGLSTGFLRQDMQTTFSGNVPDGLYPGPFSTTSYNQSSFTGLGPRLGMRLAYNTANGFGLLGETAVSALIGQSNATLNYTSSGAELQQKYGESVNNQSITDQTSTQVVPGIDAKLGIQYKHTFSKDTIFTVQAGYQGAVYINAINQYMPSSLVEGAPIQTGGIFVATMAHTQSNYSVRGPFLKVGMQF